MSLASQLIALSTRIAVEFNTIRDEISALSTGGVNILSTQPGSPSAGDLWLDNDDGVMYVYYDSTWIELGNPGAMGPAGADGGVDILNTAPTSPSPGDLWLDDNTGIMYIYYDSTWIEYGAPGSNAPDPWTYVVLAENAVSTSTANVDTALSFAPEAGKLYEVEGVLFLQSNVTTTGVRPGINWPDSNVSQNVGWITSGTSATAFVSRVFGNTTTANAAATGVPVINEGIYGSISASFVTSGTPSSNFTVTLASEIAASEVRIMANSWIKYRTITI